MHNSLKIPMALLNNKPMSLAASANAKNPFVFSYLPLHVDSELGLQNTLTGNGVDVTGACLR